MPDLLLELLSEEIPARMQGRAAEDLRKRVTDALVERGFLYEAAQAFATPRRLALHVVGLPAKGKDVREERKGPRVGAPDAAVAGFLKSAGLASKDGLTVQSDPKKGDFYVAIVDRAGRPTPDVLAEILPAIIRDFPWPKSMRWGAASAEAGALRWVRPLQSILCTFDTEIETPEIVPFAVDGVVAGDTTRGHRFMAPGAITVRRFEDYVAALERAKVMLDPARRRDIIREDAKNLAFAQGLEVIEDEALLEEVAGLVEWPVVLAGSFDESFLAVPAEAIRATIRQNQKCFVLRDARLSQGERPSAPEARPGEGRALSGEGTPLTRPAAPASARPLPPGEAGALASRFVLVANIEARDGGAAIVAGNERVVRARLSDARFFWEQDLAKPLGSRLAKLDSIVFHEKLGTQGERVERIAALARELAPVTGADPALAERAARLAKADLTTEMVGEFPELQGLMGRYYAAAQGEDPAVALAIEEHYRPLGPSDRVPTDPVSVAVALADKLDTLVGFWAIDEKPTGSKDPYALRRAALGVIRLMLENEVSLSIAGPMVIQMLRIEAARLQNDLRPGLISAGGLFRLIEVGSDPIAHGAPVVRDAISLEIAAWTEGERKPIVRLMKSAGDLLAFFHDRLKVYLRDRGARHDLIDAVLGAGQPQPPHAEVPGEAGPRSTRDHGASFEAGLQPAPQDEEQEGFGPRKDDLLAVVRRVEALGRFLDTEDGANLLAGTKRAANILRIEEKKDGRIYDAAPDPAALILPEEKALAGALDIAAAEAEAAIGREDFEGAMAVLAGLRTAVDAFFDTVTVNDPDPRLRANRLDLLAGLRRATRAVADFSRIGG